MAESTNQRPLFVDLDGVLIASDMLWEAVAQLVRQDPVMLILIPLWLLRGKAFLKYQVARRVNLDTEKLPYREDVIEYLKQQKQSGRLLVLATAADYACAKPVADHLSLFDDILASDGRVNLRGQRKREAINQYLLDHGMSDDYDFISDSKADLPAIEAAESVLLVNPTPSLFDDATRFTHIERVFGRTTGWVFSLIKACRPTQWVKNCLLIVPLFVGHETGDFGKWVALLIAFICFGLCASSVYLLNDLLDLSADRRHPKKCNRPIAAGRVPVGVALAAVGTLLLASFLLSLVVSLQYFAIIAVYFIATTGYSLHFKRKAILDVLFLAGLYTLRIIAGGVAVDIEPSRWLLAFSMFFFLSLAFAKRYAELAMIADKNSGDSQAPARGYFVGDIDLIAAVGLTSGYMSVLVFCLYISSPDVMEHYQHPGMLWLICPVFLYWLTRIWLFARRRTLHDDPVLFALKDRASYVTGLLTLLLVILAAG